MNDKVFIAVIILKNHAIEWWTNKIMQEPNVVANLTWVGFKELLDERFMPEYQKLYERMNMVQRKHTWSLKAYMHNFNAQILIATPRMEKMLRNAFS